MLSPSPYPWQSCLSVCHFPVRLRGTFSFTTLPMGLMDSNGASMGPALYKRASGVVGDVRCHRNNAGPVSSAADPAVPSELNLR